MKRILLYVAILIGVLAVPLERTDVADLHPVQTVALYKTAKGYRIETDTDDAGSGATVAQAFADLLATTPGVIYLDTADYLLISKDEEAAADEMRSYLKNGVRLCAAVGEGDLKIVSEFLSVQGDIPYLRDWELGDRLPVLDCREERIKFM
ncbi:MAG: hypothetical protein IJB02_05055 [Oscillospiraceae bacterium]|nr:hypothetical protein [Oscillospiraceae bacterium]